MKASWLTDTLSRTLQELAVWARQGGQDELSDSLQDFAANPAAIPWHELASLGASLQSELGRPIEAFAFHAAATQCSPSMARGKSYLAAVEICRQLTTATDQKTKFTLFRTGFASGLVELLTDPMPTGLDVGQCFSVLMIVAKLAHLSQHHAARQVAIATLPHFVGIAEKITPNQALTFYMALLPVIWGHAGTLAEMVEVDPLLDGLRRNIRHYTVPRLGERRHSAGRAVAYFTVFNSTTSGIGCMTHNLAAAHASHRPADKVHLYIYGGDNAESIAYHCDTGVCIRVIPTQDVVIETISALRQQLEDDGVDVLIADNIFAITVASLSARVAPIQLMLEMTHIYGNLPEVDWWFLGAVDFRPRMGLPVTPSSILPEARPPRSLASPDLAGAAAIREALPQGAVIIGSICRLTKVQPHFLAVLGRLLAEETSTHLLICGSGDAGLIEDWIITNGLGSRVTLVNEHVPVPSYGVAIDVFMETWPFIGGATATEIMSFGRPVVSMHSEDFPVFLANGRDPELLARDEDHYVTLLRRLVVDVDWRAEKAAVARAISERRADSSAAISEILSVIDRLRANC